MGLFSSVLPAPPDAIFGIQAAYAKDLRESKVNLSIGVYKTPELKPPILASVKKGEEFILESERTKEYLPIEGAQIFIEKTGHLVFGDKIWGEVARKTCCVQSLGGTGAL